MAVTIALPGLLQEHADGRARLELDASPATMADAMEALRDAWPAVYARIMTESRDVRPHVNLFVGDTEIRHTGGLATPIPDGAEILVLPAVSGG